MITANVIHRVFRIRYRDFEGTGFTVDVRGKEYLVTAKHLVEELDDRGMIGIFSNGDWAPLEVEVVGHSPADADISVLAAARILTPQGLPMEVGAGGLIYGQDVYFLGFPYGYTGSFVFADGGYPLPFVKKATVSLLDRKKMILDGHNNPASPVGLSSTLNPIGMTLRWLVLFPDTALLRSLCLNTASKLATYIDIIPALLRPMESFGRRT